MEYEGLLIEQLPGAPKLVLFSAPVYEIETWSGIPQRRRVDGQVETAGFQREEKAKRVADIAAFMSEPANVIQNPLLAAVQDENLVAVKPTDNPGCCRVTISLPRLDQMSLKALVKGAMSELERRAPDLASRPTDAALLGRLRVTLSLVPSSSATDEEAAVAEFGGEGEDSGTMDSGADATVALFDDESQVVDFYDELNARHAILEEMAETADHLDSIAGFSRDFLSSLVKPVVLVDGQHRLKGAMRAIQDYEESDEGAEFLANQIDNGSTPEEARNVLRDLKGRRLPVSLLLSADPAEHVFQFVVVNQKATQMSNALLGTIVSTSLTHDEMDPIRERLRNAGIELEGSRAISYMRRAQESPFRGLVATGVAGDRPYALPWSVLGGLISIVRYLEGGTPYHPPTVDYARLWRLHGFKNSALVGTDLPPDERLRRWSEIDGPWRTLFTRLHTKIRDKFGNVDDPRTQNYWGATRSNLFNMVSLRILTADFFAFITDRSFNDWDEVDMALEDWIGDLNDQYFARDWRMGGTKKDQPAIKSAWSATWAEYRLTRDRLPRVEKYNPGGKGVGN